MASQIIWSSRAVDNLHEIFDYIARDSERYALLQIEEILNSANMLSAFPLAGRKTTEFPELPYREIFKGNYRVLYRFEELENKVFIISIIHVRRSLKDLLP